MAIEQGDAGFTVIGTDVRSAELDGQPMVAVRMVLDRGTPPGKPGMGPLALYTLDQAQELAQHLTRAIAAIRAAG